MAAGGGIRCGYNRMSIGLEYRFEGCIQFANRFFGNLPADADQSAAVVNGTGLQAVGD